MPIISMFMVGAAAVAAAIVPRELLVRFHGSHRAEAEDATVSPILLVDAGLSHAVGRLPRRRLVEQRTDESHAVFPRRAKAVSIELADATAPTDLDAKVAGRRVLPLRRPGTRRRRGISPP